jgi:superoxide dismutase, Fe-Mn family
MKHELPQLPYSYDALETAIDAKTMELHHSKHHAGYITKLNTALEKYIDLQEKTLEDLLINIDTVPEEIRGAVKNNGNQTYNHNIFWQTMTPEKQEITGKLLELIVRDFGTVDNFKKDFITKSQNVFGSGWVWLFINKENKLEVKQYANEGNPLKEGTPLLPLDVWEHAYYLRYQNRRPEYIDSWWNIINWDVVSTFIK